VSSQCAAQVTGTTTLTTTTETVAATIAAPPELQSPSNGQGLLVSGTVNVTGGTATTTVTVRVRQGSLTGAVVGDALVNTVVAATAPDTYAYQAIDPTLTYLNGETYVVTVQLAGATANGSVNYADIGVEPLTSANG
jgi:hypothetical protein